MSARPAWHAMDVADVCAALRAATLPRQGANATLTTINLGGALCAECCWARAAALGRGSCP